MHKQRPGAGAHAPSADQRPRPVSVQIVSPSRLFSEGLALLLAQHMPESVSRAFEAAGPDGEHGVLLIDGNLALATTLECIRACRSVHPHAPILVADLCDRVDDVVACIEAGAGGYTLRGDGVETLVEALRMLYTGRAACSPEVAARVFARLAAARDGLAPQAGPDPDLTPREREILGYLAADYSNQQIAAALVIEVRTVKHHVHNILAKLRARHRWQAVAVAQAQGLIERDPSSSSG
ncbi:MAG: response regulator transcription factor [Chloroflexaceae bacterium]|nr:response regulator transcription factor [Chloroflexaceae bacterium]